MPRTEHPIVTLIWPDNSPRGVLYQEDIDDLCQEHAECLAMWAKIKAPGTPHNEICRLLKEEAPYYRTYEALDGTRHPVDYLNVQTADELRKNPTAVLLSEPRFEQIEESEPLLFQRKDGSLYFVYLFYASNGSESERLEAARQKLRLHPVVVWVGWPSGSPRPKMGITFEDFEKKGRAWLEAIEIDYFADAGQFPKDPGGAITNTDPHWKPMADGESPPPVTIRHILADLHGRFRRWPRSCDGQLFVPVGNSVQFLLNENAIFGWLGNFGVVQWYTGLGFARRGDVFEEVKRNALQYDAIETLPHEPPLYRHFYLYKSKKEGDGTSLESLLDRFSPATPIDRQLIKAMLLTPIWGGACGRRPAFLITADAGRGTGKSTMAQLVGHLFGGYFDISHNEDIAMIKQRLLSSKSMGLRLAILDNVKSHRFSWAELESILTASVISGKKMYVGESSRPNTLTWLLTLNGASLSTDMAQRVVTIHIRRPERSSGWEDETRTFIDEHRDLIVADISAALRSPKTTLTEFSRWAAWEAAVLGCLSDPEECQRVILERQAAADIEKEESSAIEDFFAEQLEKYGYSPADDRVFIPSRIACDWFNLAMNERASTTAVSRRLRQMENEGAIKKISYGREWIDDKNFRGFFWSGEEWFSPRGTHADLEQTILFKSGGDLFG